MQHFYISNRLQNEVNSPCEIVVEGGRSDRQYAHIQPIEPDDRCWLRLDLMANGLAFGDRGL
jgi:hypothetical protein